MNKLFEFYYNKYVNDTQDFEYEGKNTYQDFKNYLRVYLKLPGNIYYKPPNAETEQFHEILKYWNK